MMDRFTFPGLPQRVVFGSGTLSETAAELARLGRSRALVLSTPGQNAAAEALAATFGPLSAGVFAGAVMHTPVGVTEQAMAALTACSADCVVALGGGSAVGLSKALALRSGVDQIVIPTTYAGSEMTDILGETAGGVKTTQRNPAIRPEVVIYDVSLTLALPMNVTVTSALNAIAHAAEALYAPDRNPVVLALATEALGLFKTALPVLIANPADPAARAQALYAAWCCSTALGQVSMALHHKLCHTLGGAFNLAHADTHAILLPHTVAFNAQAVPDLLAPLAAVFGSIGPGLFDFAARIGAPQRLADLGLTEADLDHAAALAVKAPYPNPRPFDQADIRTLLQNAWAGVRP